MMMEKYKWNIHYKTFVNELLLQILFSNSNWIHNAVFPCEYLFF